MASSVQQDLSWGLSHPSEPFLHSRSRERDKTTEDSAKPILKSAVVPDFGVRS